MDAERLKNPVQKISKQIIAASQLRLMLVSMKPGLSLGDVCYLVAQDLDKKSGNPTVSQIENASTEEKQLLNHTFRLLSKDFIQVNESDLKVSTLL